MLIVRSKHEAMQHVTQEIDWVNLFLDGVFPNVDKGKIRSKREGPGMHVIPDNVMSHARGKQIFLTYVTILVLDNETRN